MVKENQFLNEEEINKLNFFETLYYIQTLNQIDKKIKEETNE